MHLPSLADGGCGTTLALTRVFGGLSLLAATSRHRQQTKRGGGAVRPSAVLTCWALSSLDSWSNGLVQRRCQLAKGQRTSPVMPRPRQASRTRERKEFRNLPTLARDCPRAWGKQHWYLLPHEEEVLEQCLRQRSSAPRRQRGRELDVDNVRLRAVEKVRRLPSRRS